MNNLEVKGEKKAHVKLLGLQNVFVNTREGLGSQLPRETKTNDQPEL